MTTVLSTFAPAKINVCLLLGPVREPDSRHELVTVFQPLDLGDDVRLEDAPAGADGDVVTCEPPLPDRVGDNLALRALAAFRQETGWDAPPLAIHIDKRIPVAGGMAGGSADAGAVLRLAARRSGLLADPDEALALRAVAATLGADVPALVAPRRWLGTGAGEILEPLPAPAGRYGVIAVTSDEGLPTPEVFREADRLGLSRDGAGLAAGLAELRAHAADLPGELCVNELEPATLSLRPALRDTLAVLRFSGAEIAIVSGSGPTCVGLFRTLEDAAEAAPGLERRFPGHVRVCSPLSETDAR